MYDFPRKILTLDCRFHNKDENRPYCVKISFTNHLKTQVLILSNCFTSLKQLLTQGKSKSISSKTALPRPIGPVLLGGTHLGCQSQGSGTFFCETWTDQEMLGTFWVELVITREGRSSFGVGTWISHQTKNYFPPRLANRQPQWWHQSRGSYLRYHWYDVIVQTGRTWPACSMECII